MLEGARGAVSSIKNKPKEVLIIRPKDKARQQIRFRGGDVPEPGLKEAPGQHLVAPNRELESAPEVRLFYSEAETVSVNGIHRKGKETQDNWQKAKAASSEGKPAQEQTMREDKAQMTILSIQGMEDLAHQPDGNYKSVVPFEKEIKDSSGKVLDRYNDIAVKGQDGSSQVIRGLVGKKGGNFLCKIDGADEPVAIPIQDVIRGQVIAEADSLRGLFTTPAEQDLFDKYVGGLKGEASHFEFKTDDERDAFKSNVAEVAKTNGILMMDDIRTSIDAITGWKGGDTPPNADATEEEKHAWKARETMRSQLLETKSDATLCDAETFRRLYDRDLVPQINQARAESATLREEGANPIDIMRADQNLGALRLIKSKPELVQTYFDAVQTAAIPQANARAIIDAVREGNFVGSLTTLQKDVMGHLTDVDAAKASKEDLKNIGKRNRTIVFGGIGLLLALAYLAQSQLTNE